MKRIAYSKAALRALLRMPRYLARLIRARIGQYAAGLGSLGNNVRALKGAPGYLRLRVGDWLVMLGETEDEITVVRTAPRGEAYE